MMILIIVANYQRKVLDDISKINEGFRRFFVTYFKIFTPNHYHCIIILIDKN